MDPELFHSWTFHDKQNNFTNRRFFNGLFTVLELKCALFSEAATSQTVSFGATAKRRERLRLSSLRFYRLPTSRYTGLRRFLPPFTADIPAETATFPGRRLSDQAAGPPPSGSPRVPLLLLGPLPVRLQPVTSSPRTLRSTRR
ncbi:Hypothetical predicted protein, partial [Xyrichtys novacula]|uniref:Uncharacterized protein n=1 Tax=Xyrichtys novacula TaxID=13765 RepID=A0AAV1GM82_XYRNO